MRLFADDTAAYLAITKIADGQQLQEDLSTLHQWEVDWDTEFNPGKCPGYYTLHGQDPTSKLVISCMDKVHRRRHIK